MNIYIMVTVLWCVQVFFKQSKGYNSLTKKEGTVNFVWDKLSCVTELRSVQVFFKQSKGYNSETKKRGNNQFCVGQIVLCY